MAIDTHSNFTYGTVATAPSPATTGTSMVLGTSDFASFPDPAGTGNTAYNLSVWPAGSIPTTGNAEIMRMTVKGTNGTVNMARAQESSSARTVVVGDQVAMAITKKTLTDVESGDGWSPANETWTFATASTITVPTGAASKYQKGDRIKWTQTTVKYGVIVAVADTLLTILVNTDYTVANAAISANFYSHEENPIGYPTWFAFTTTWSSYSTAPALGNGTLVAYVKVDGATMTIKLELFTGSTSTYGTGIYYFTLPNNPTNSRQDVGGAWFLTSSTGRPGVSLFGYNGVSGVEFLTSPNSPVSATNPATWASGDRLNAFFSYQF